MNHTSGNDKTGLEEVLEKLVGADMLGTSVYQDVKAEHDKRLSEKRINMVATESETPPQPSEPSNLSSRTIEGLNIPQYCRDIRAAKDMYMVVAIGTHLEARICDLITQARKEANEQGFYAGCGISGVELYAVPDLYKKYRKALESGEYHDRIVELQNEQ